MRYFLTGATGFVGGRVARQLIAAGHTVTAVVRDPAKAQDLAALGVRLAPGDVTDQESLRAPMTGADGVFHIAGWYKIGVKDKRPGEAVNIQGTQNVLEVMRALGIPKGVYTSTLAVNSDTGGRRVDETYHFSGGRHLSEYDRTKALAHEIAETFVAQGLPLVIVQPGLIYGPGDTSSVRTTLRQYLRRQLPVVPQQTAFCWAHVDDIARGHLLAMEKGRPGQSYFLAGPVHTMPEALALAQQITGIPAPGAAPAGVFKALSAVMGLVEQIVPVPESYTAEGLRIIAGTTYIGDNAKARRELGWEPRPLAEGLRETLEHELKLLA
ncbi:MAG: NAD-dependent epimerase/dehydratase family protein [Anaerolineales bacterium]|nr:NAD-dependent epimerase/dehydratase family protein [Anaerolineales bacterium]